MQFEYELVLLTKVQPTDGEKNILLEKIKKSIEKSGFEVSGLNVSEDISGRKKLMYSIKGNQEAHFSYFSLKTADKGSIEKANTELKLNKEFHKEVIRFLFVDKNNL